MAEKKNWYQYTDESGKSWRMLTTTKLAEIGNLNQTDDSTFPQLSPLIKARYIWLEEHPRPEDRLRARQKVILAPGRLKEIMDKRLSFQIGGKEMVYCSYYGEDVSLK